MDAQQLGERLSRLESGQGGLDRRIVEMQAANEADHGEVKRLLTEIRDEVGKKASNEALEKLAGRTDKSEKRLDQIFAIVALVVFLGPLMFGLLLLYVGGGS